MLTNSTYQYVIVYLPVNFNVAIHERYPLNDVKDVDSLLSHHRKPQGSQMGFQKPNDQSQVSPAATPQHTLFHRNRCKVDTTTRRTLSLGKVGRKQLESAGAEFG